MAGFGATCCVAENLDVTSGGRSKTPDSMKGRAISPGKESAPEAEDVIRERQSRIARRDELVKERAQKEMQECTFKPSISKASAGLAEKAKSKDRVDRVKSEDDSAFSPQISLTSLKIVEKLKRGDVVNRLYGEAEVKKKGQEELEQLKKRAEEESLSFTPQISIASLDIASKKEADRGDIISRLSVTPTPRPKTPSQERPKTPVNRSTPNRPTTPNGSRPQTPRTPNMMTVAQYRELMKKKADSSARAPLALEPNGHEQEPVRSPAKGAETPRSPLSRIPQRTALSPMRSPSGDVSKLLAEKDEEIRRLREENAELQGRVKAMESFIGSNKFVHM